MSSADPFVRLCPSWKGRCFVEILDRVRSSGEPFLGQSVHVVLNRGFEEAAEDCYFDFVYQPVVGEDHSVDSIVVIAHDVTALASAKHEAESPTGSRTNSWRRCRTSCARRSTRCSGTRKWSVAGSIEPHRLPAVLETIERNAQLQEQLISDVLDVSRIITGKLRLDIQPVDLPRVHPGSARDGRACRDGEGRQAASRYRAARRAGCRRRAAAAADRVEPAVERDQVHAARRARADPARQRVNSHVELTVSDTGEGIAPEFLPHLFERFRQADSTFTRSHGGLGLGLAISRHLVEAHGGRIQAMSPGKGRGTTVRVELPLMIVHDGRSQTT